MTNLIMAYSHVVTERVHYVITNNLSCAAEEKQVSLVKVTKYKLDNVDSTPGR
jgi:hypothetical protein